MLQCFHLAHSGTSTSVDLTCKGVLKSHKGLAARADWSEAKQQSKRTKGSANNLGILPSFLDTFLLGGRQSASRTRGRGPKDQNTMRSEDQGTEKTQTQNNKNFQHEMQQKNRMLIMLIMLMVIV